MKMNMAWRSGIRSKVHRIERFKRRTHLRNFTALHNKTVDKSSARRREGMSLLSVALQGIRRAFDGFIVVLCENGSWLMFEVSCGKASPPSKRVKDPSVTSKSFRLFFCPVFQLLSRLCQRKSFFRLTPFSSRSLSLSSYRSHFCLAGRLFFWFTANLFIRPSLSSLSK